RQPLVEFDTELPSPACVLEDLTIAPIDLGTATHLVLQHLDFSRDCDRADLREQIAGMVRTRRIAPALAEAVDVDSIVWLMSTVLGRMLRENAGQLRREVPVYYPIVPPGASEASDPLDRIMVRGRIDVLIPDSTGLVVADFKTDRVTEQTIDQRVEFYRPQVDSYRGAIERISGQKVKAAYLAFLTPRILREV
ncbi:MAG TPA: PD-(D/E)XK nuclease family protein, partial [Tepidisphaeraceae bacterium]|nr:PD-(D/E)XK nuclease family protein [Tepidisphaeraceae bacterium]